MVRSEEDCDGLQGQQRSSGCGPFLSEGASPSVSRVMRMIFESAVQDGTGRFVAFEWQHGFVPLDAEEHDECKADCFAANFDEVLGEWMSLGMPPVRW